MSVPLFTIERVCRPRRGWAAFSVDPAGGVGPRASKIFRDLARAEAWVAKNGRLTEPFGEAA
jgi:hypothetical protein